MKNKLWLVQIPVILFFAACFWVTEIGIDGKLENAVVREKIFPWLRRITSVATDAKFHLRGVVPPKNKIVVVEVDDLALSQFGRWPWHRDLTARLIDGIFAAGAKVVGLDMVFSETDRRVPAELAEAMEKQGIHGVADRFETDPVMTATVVQHADQLVLGMVTESACQPFYSTAEECPVTNPDALAQMPASLPKFALEEFQVENGAVFDPTRTPVLSFPTVIPNLPEYSDSARHQAFFNAATDPDGYIRRINLVLLGGGKAYPALALEMARIGLKERLSIRFDGHNRVEQLAFANSGRAIHVSPQGVMDINFRGPKSNSFTYVSATDVLAESDQLQDPLNRKLAGVSKKETLRDAYVLVGSTAIGADDLRHFPFEEGVPGVDGHAQILDNLLSGDELVSGGQAWWSRGRAWVTALMLVAALAFGVALQRLEAVPALALSVLGFMGFGVIDVKALFAHDINWNTGFFYLEAATLFVMTLAMKYVAEERNKKFIRSAFSKYVAPAVVDSIMKDPESLMLGGVKKELTILFSDIRGFTTMSEAMDAKALASFLNDYLGIMTGIVFKHDGTLDKYIGDAVMAFWGAPLDQPNHARRSCLAAIDMMKALEENRPRFKSQYGFDVDIGIGVNSGLVNVGNMGSENNFEYTVIGDHVNLASRLEGLTKYYGASIITSRFTFNLLSPAAPLGLIEAGAPPVVEAELPPHRTLDFVKVKGKKNAVELIQLLHRDYPIEAMQAYEAGRLAYAARKWDEAIAELQRASELILGAFGQADGPSQLLIERCEDFKRTPPEEGWDGSWEMQSK